MLDNKDREEIAHIMRTVIESHIDPKFELLFDKMNAMEEKLIPESRVEDIEHMVNVHEMAIRKLSKDVKELKEA